MGLIDRTATGRRPRATHRVAFALAVAFVFAGSATFIRGAQDVPPPVPSGNRPPVLDEIANQRVGAHLLELLPFVQDFTTLQVTASDPNTTDILTYSVTELIHPSGTRVPLSSLGITLMKDPLDDRVALIFIDLPNLSNSLDLGVWRMRVLVADGNGGSDEQEVFITVGTFTNNSPSFTAAGPVNIIFAAQGSSIVLNFTASDPDTADTMTLRADGLPPGASFGESTGNPASSTFLWTPGAGQSGLHHIRFEATDNGSPQITESIVTRIYVGSCDFGPEIWRLDPNKGPASGGTLVTLHGSGLTSDTRVMIGGNDVNNLNILDCTRATFNLPLGMEGPQDVTVTSREMIATLSAGVFYTMDVPPAVPSDPDLVESTDTGDSNSDNVTNSTTLVFKGMSDPDVTIELLDSGMMIGSGQSGTDGTWTTTISALSEGTHSISAQAKNEAGLTSAESAALNVTIDLTAPGTPGTPVGAPNPNNTGTHTVTWAASTDTTTGGAAFSGYDVLWSADGGATFSLVARGLAAESFTEPLSLPEGAYFYRIRARDGAGNTSAPTADSAVVLVDKTSPTAPTVDIVPAVVNLANRAAVEVSMSGEVGATVSGTVSVGSTSAPLSGIIPASGTLSLTVSFAHVDAEGVLTASARQTDLAANASAAGSDTVSFDTIAPPAPSTPDLLPDSGPSSTDNITNDNRPTFTGTSEAMATVELLNDLTELGATTADPGGTWRIPIADALADGMYRVKARATDLAGNASIADSDILPITIDTIVATITIETPQDGDSYIVGQTISVAYNCLDIGGSGVFECIGPTANGAPLDTSVIGAYSFTVTATDLAGNTATRTHAYTVIKASTTTTIISHPNPSVFGDLVDFTATVGVLPPGAGTPSGTVQFNVDGAPLGTLVPLIDGKASIRTDTVSVGTHIIITEYGGDLGLDGSIGTLELVVNKADTSTALTSSLSPSIEGEAVTFRSTVRYIGRGEVSVPVTEGTVLYDNLELGGAAEPFALDTNGEAAVTTSTLSVGEHLITAQYNGTENFNPSSGSVTQRVKLRPNPVWTVTDRTGTATFFDGETNQVKHTVDVGKGGTNAAWFFGSARTITGDLFTPPAKLYLTIKDGILVLLGPVSPTPDTAFNFATGGVIDLGNRPVTLQGNGTELWAGTDDDSVKIIDIASDTVTHFVPLTVSESATGKGKPKDRKIGRRPVAIRFNPGGDVAFVAGQKSDNVIVIDAARRLILSSVDVGREPVGLALSPDGSTLYAANRKDETVTVVDVSDPAAPRVLDEIAVGKKPGGVALLNDGTKLYVTSSGTDSVSVFDALSGPPYLSLRLIIDVGHKPSGITVTRPTTIGSGDTVYVANENDDTVSVIDAATDGVIATVPVGKRPTGVATGLLPQEP